jgi:hypothetical protein
MRAMSVPVDEVSDIAGFVLPHTRVDVLVSLSEGDKSLSRIVLQNVEVLAVAQDIEQVDDKPQTVHVVTVLVTPAQAERLTLASREGTLRLAMRNYDDKQIVNTDGIDLTQMMGNGPAPPPVAMVNNQAPLVVPRVSPPRPQPVQVEILRDGKTAESVSFIRGNSLHTSTSTAAPGSPAHSPDHPPGGGLPDLPSSSGDSLPSGDSPLPATGLSTSPLGALSAPPAASPPAAGMVDGGAPAAVLLPRPAADTSSATSSDGGFNGPKSRTIDVP